MSDAPIEPRDYIAGVKVVDIGDLRVARGEARRPRSLCSHVHQVYDQKERRVWCEDCETELEPFDAYRTLIENLDRAVKKLARREKELKEAEQFAARVRATKALDKVWRSQTMTPVCPHCHTGLLPEEFVGGVKQMDRSLARKMAEGRKEPRP